MTTRPHSSSTTCNNRRALPTKAAKPHAKVLDYFPQVLDYFLQVQDYFAQVLDYFAQVLDFFRPTPEPLFSCFPNGMPSSPSAFSLAVFSTREQQFFSEKCPPYYSIFLKKHPCKPFYPTRFAFLTTFPYF